MILLSGNSTGTANLAVDGVGDAFLPLAMLVLAVVVVGALLHAYQGLRGYKRVRKVLYAVGRFLALAVLGVPAAAALAAFGVVVWFAWTADAEAQAEVLRWSGRVLVSVVVLAGLGWVTERVTGRFQDYKEALEVTVEGDHGDDEDQEGGDGDEGLDGS